MKRILLLMLLALLYPVFSSACTNIIVGKKASQDGSLISTYNCDSFGYISPLVFNPAALYPSGSLLTLRGMGPSAQAVRTIPQVEHTHGVVGLMNDCQVSIVETTWGGRQELVNPEGYFDYDLLMNTTLQRASSAREAIKIINDLVMSYGYCSSGENFGIVDRDEAWIMEIIGMGPGRKGAVWVALRLPDDCITAYANSSRIQTFPQTAKLDKKLGFYCLEDCMYSRECISLARQMGYFTGPDREFSWREAYGPVDFETVRACDARVWSFFRHHTDPEEMDRYLPYLSGEFDKVDHLPLWIRPDAPLSVRDVMEDMRDHYEGTALDMTVDVSAGPWASPYRNRPLSFNASDGTAMFRERPIGCQQSAMTMVLQSRGWLPDAVGGVTYFNMDDATMVAYVPVYAGITRVPDAFLEENNRQGEFSYQSAFWLNNFVANMVYPRYSALMPDLLEARKALEDYYAKDQTEVEARALELTPERLKEYLTGKTLEYTALMMERWEQLSRLLIVKHNDQVIRPRDGQRPGAPAYAPAFIDAVKAQTGDRYLTPVR